VFTEFVAFDAMFQCTHCESIDTISTSEVCSNRFAVLGKVQVPLTRMNRVGKVEGTWKFQKEQVIGIPITSSVYQGISRGFAFQAWITWAILVNLDAMWYMESAFCTVIVKVTRFALTSIYSEQGIS
jgi:hypothetical protein